MIRVQHGYLFKNVFSLILLFSLPLLSICTTPGFSSGEQRIVSPILLLLQNNGLCESGPETLLVNGRLWQRCDSGQRLTWQEAEDFCSTLTIGGRTDWRLPTKEELKSLVVCSNGVETPLNDYPQPEYYCGGSSNDQTYNSPTISTSFVAQKEFYWSAGTYYGDYRWGVYFFSGFADWEHATNNSLTRCISERMF